MTDQDYNPAMPSPQPQAPPVPPAPDAQQQDTIDELPQAQPRISFWQQPWVQNIVPFATSLIIHVAVLALGFAAIKTVPRVYEVVKEQIIIPDAQIIEGADPGGVPNPGLGDDPNRAAAQDEFQEVPDDSGLSNTQVQTLNRSLMAGGAENEMAVNLLAIGPQKGGPGTGDNVGDGDPGGGLAPFGIPGGGAAGPRAQFMGGGGNATRIVFVCDASGSMINKFEILKSEIRKSVDTLVPVQGFNIVFFKDNQAFALDSSRLVMANPQGKGRAFDFLKEIFTGPTSAPIPALEIAFQQDAQLIFFLTDGFEFAPSNQQVVERVEQMVNAKEGRVKVNTIFFGDPGYDKNDPGFQTLRTIADMTGGTFRVVTEQDL